MFRDDAIIFISFFQEREILFLFKGSKLGGNKIAQILYLFYFPVNSFLGTTNRVLFINKIL